MSRVILDPIARTGGHIRLEADVAGAVTSAYLTGTTFRGLEKALVGRDARDAWLLAERVCGAAAGIHGLASVRAIESALELRVPRNARLLRNILTGATYVQNHVAHFYLHEVPDWADASAALRADPAAASLLAMSLSDWPRALANDFQAAKDRLATLVADGALAREPWGHPAYEMSPEASLMLYSHFFDALDWQRKLVSLRTILGGKSPHPQTFSVGGMVIASEWGGPTNALGGEHPWRAARHAAPPLSADAIAEMSKLIGDSGQFIDVFLGDLRTVAAHYPDWFGLGGGIGHYVSFGEFPLDDAAPGTWLLPAGRVMDRDLATLRDVTAENVAESIAHAWHRSDDAAELLKPDDAETQPDYRGPQPPYDTLAGIDAYSWIKAPRYADDPMEAGPLARVVVGYASGKAEIVSSVDELLRPLGQQPQALFGTLGRMLARGVEARIVMTSLNNWLRELVDNLASGDHSVVDLAGYDTSRWPAEARGCGMVEGPQGAIGHWVGVSGRRIRHYQVVDANGWNLSPRDNRGRPGAAEKALEGIPVVDRSNPLEVGRTLRTFDPCATCAAH